MRERLNKYWISIEPQIPFIIVVWSIGFYMLAQVATKLSISEPQKIHRYHILFLLLAFLFILLPFIKKIKVGKYIELERNIKETKEEVKDFKSEMRQNIQILSSSISASIGNLNSHVNIQIPNIENLKNEVENLETITNGKDTSKLKEIRSQLLPDEDLTMALARTRFEIERLLRNVLGKKNNLGSLNKIEIKYLSLSQLFNEYVQLNPEFYAFKESFRYVQSICNAAIHGQHIASNQAEEALKLGSIIISELKQNESITTK